MAQSGVVGVCAITTNHLIVTSATTSAGEEEREALLPPDRKEEMATSYPPLVREAARKRPVYERKQREKHARSGPWGTALPSVPTELTVVASESERCVGVATGPAAGLRMRANAISNPPTSPTAPAVMPGACDGVTTHFSGWLMLSRFAFGNLRVCVCVCATTETLKTEGPEENSGPLLSQRHTNVTTSIMHSGMKEAAAAAEEQGGGNHTSAPADSQVIPPHTAHALTRIHCQVRGTSL